MSVSKSLTPTLLTSLASGDQKYIVRSEEFLSREESKNDEDSSSVLRRCLVHKKSTDEHGQSGILARGGSSFTAGDAQEHSASRQIER